MLNKTIKCLLIASTFHVASSLAGVIDSEDSNTSGVNDTLATAQDLGAVSDINPLTVKGWVDSNNANDVDFYQFSVADPSTLFFDITLAYTWDENNKTGLGLDTALWIFNATGELVAWNDDSDVFRPWEPNGTNDAFIGGLSLANGSYYAVVSFFGNYANAWYQTGIDFDPINSNPSLVYSGNKIAGATPETSFENLVNSCLDINDPSLNCTGQYQLQIRSNFNPIPEPASLSLVGAGLLGFYLRRRLIPAQPKRALASQLYPA